MKKLLNIISIIIIINSKAYCQSYDGICHAIQKVGYPIQNFRYTAYSDNYVIRDKYKSIDEIKNNTPEELLKSQISVTNNKWLSKNYGVEKKWSEKQFQNLHEKGNFLVLIGKLEIKYNDEVYSVVKFNMSSKERIIPASLVMRKEGDTWLFDEDSLISNLSFIFMSLSGDDLYYIFNNIKSKSKVIDDLIDNSWENNKFNYSFFLESYASLLFDSSYKNNPKNYSIKFKDNQLTKLKNVNGVVPFRNQEYCSFFKNESSQFNNTIVKDLVNKIISTTDAIELLPLSFFKCTFLNRTNYYLKYTIKNSEKNEVIEVSMFDIDFNFIKNSGDAVKGLFSSNSKEELDAIFLKSSDVIKFSR